MIGTAMNNMWYSSGTVAIRHIKGAVSFAVAGGAFQLLVVLLSA